MDQYRVRPNQKLKLKDRDPADTSAFAGSEDEAKERLKQVSNELEDLQELLYAQHKHKLLIVLQGMDTSGKDGTIRHVFEEVDPQGVSVVSFKKPTPEEMDHDYLWRVHEHVPGKGEIVIFNRSHYEDVLVVRVDGLAPPDVWRKRYDHINDFERMLVDEGTTIRKIFLYISPEAQKDRLQSRLDKPQKRWKFNPADLEKRKQWDDYLQAYEDVLNKTSTDWAPWYVVPSDRKWYRNLVVASVLVETLRGLNMRYPAAVEGLDRIVIE